MKITVLMPVYNGEKYLKEAINSILNQTFTDFEFLIMDDGSTDRSASIIESYNDKRIRLIRYQKNRGLTKMLNLGLNIAKGEYIVRMDADDISLPHRLEKQYEYMSKNKDIAVCGCWLETFGNNKRRLWKYLENSDDIKANLFFACPLAHPAIMINKSIFEKHNLFYSTEYLHSEDYELWIRASEFVEFYNYPKILLHYRRHQKQVSKEKYNTQQEFSIKARNKLFERLEITPTEEELEIHNSLIYRKYWRTKEYLDKTEKWLSKLIEANNKTKAFEENSFKNQIGQRWFLACRKSSHLGLYAWKRYKNPNLRKSDNIPWRKSFLFLITCILGIKG